MEPRTAGFTDQVDLNRTEPPQGGIEEFCPRTEFLIQLLQSQIPGFDWLHSRDMQEATRIHQSSLHTSRGGTLAETVVDQDLVPGTKEIIPRK